MAWTEAIEHVQDEEPASASVLSRPSRQLESRTDYLRDRLGDISAGTSMLDADQPVESGLAVGMACYWNDANGRFERALSAVNIDSGVVTAALTADVVGVVSAKSSNTRGDILLGGKASLTPVLESGDAPTTGRYYLSASVPGTLVNQSGRPTPGVPVLFYCQVSGFVYVAPYVKDFIDEHVHMRFELVARPAGQTDTPIDSTYRHVITDADSSVLGWLPADDPSFNGNAPIDAIFGYNLAADPNLRAAWPPVPIQAAVLLVDRDGNGAVEIPLGPDGLAELDSNGIWWKSNCYADAPWSYDYSAPASMSSTFPSDPCPRSYRMRIYVAFHRSTYATDRHIVTSLQENSGGLVQVVDANGQAASSGDLYLQVNQALLGGDLPADFMSRFGSYQSTISGLLCESYSAGANAIAHWRIQVPSAGLPPVPVVGIRLKLHGNLGGTLPQLIMTVLRFPRADSGSALSVPSSSVSAVINTQQAVSAGQYADPISDGVTVVAGDLLLVSIVRGSSDGYAGTVSVLNVTGELRTGA